MQKILDYFIGNVRAEITCPYAERFFNFCAKNGIWLKKMERTDDITVRATLSLKDYKKLKKILPRDFTVKPLKKWGTPFIMYGVKNRYALLIGTAVCFFAVFISSMFIWQIEVTGNETLPASKILRELENLDVKPGKCGLLISQDYVSNEMLQKIPELCFLAVNIRGSRATVVVREAVEPPEIIDENEPTVLVAEKGGIISKIVALEGETVCEKGQTVLPGDILVSGIKKNKLGGTHLVHAMAKIYARTWYEKSALMPLEKITKDYTGAEKTKTSLIICGKRINLFINSGISWSNYDKITSYKYVSLFGGAALPIKIVRETYKEYFPTTMSDNTVAESLLKDHLFSSLKKEIGDGKVASSMFETDVKDGIFAVTMRAECSEQIAVMRDLTKEEIELAGIEAALEGG